MSKDKELDAKVGLVIIAVLLLIVSGLVLYAISEHNRIYGPPQIESK